MSSGVESQAFSLLQNEEFMNEVVEQALADPDVLRDLTDDIADDLEDLLEDDPQLQRQLLTRAMQDDGFKKQVIQKLVEEFSD